MILRELAQKNLDPKAAYVAGKSGLVPLKQKAILSTSAEEKVEIATEIKNISAQTPPVVKIGEEKVEVTVPDLQVQVEESTAATITETTSELEAVQPETHEPTEVAQDKPKKKFGKKSA